MNFMQEELADGRRCPLFNVIDDFNPEGLTIEANLSLPTEQVI
ncbi:hypothetical protein SALWKB2_0561 [Snodgrassella alvi wkB2]|nr:hypothetical protein SALWKB2_0561 [Snodgrassella alvi wkB2]